MPCGWEGNRRSGVALDMRHRPVVYQPMPAHGLRKGHFTLPLLNVGVTVYLLQPLNNKMRVALPRAASLRVTLSISTVGHV